MRIHPKVKNAFRGKRPWTSKTNIMGLVMGLLPFVCPKAFHYLSDNPQVQQQAFGVLFMGLTFIFRHMTGEPVSWTNDEAGDQ